MFVYVVILLIPYAGTYSSSSSLYRRNIQGPEIHGAEIKQERNAEKTNVDSNVTKIKDILDRPDKFYDKSLKLIFKNPSLQQNEMAQSIISFANDAFMGINTSHLSVDSFEGNDKNLDRSISDSRTLLTAFKRVNKVKYADEGKSDYVQFDDSASVKESNSFKEMSADSVHCKQISSYMIICSKGNDIYKIDLSTTILTNVQIKNLVDYIFNRNKTNKRNADTYLSENDILNIINNLYKYGVKKYTDKNGTNENDNIEVSIPLDFVELKKPDVKAIKLENQNDSEGFSLLKLLINRIKGNEIKDEKDVSEKTFSINIPKLKPISIVHTTTKEQKKVNQTPYNMISPPLYRNKYSSKWFVKRNLMLNDLYGIPPRKYKRTVYPKRKIRHKYKYHCIKNPRTTRRCSINEGKTGKCQLPKEFHKCLSVSVCPCGCTPKVFPPKTTCKPLPTMPEPPTTPTRCPPNEKKQKHYSNTDKK